MRYVVANSQETSFMIGYSIVLRLYLHLENMFLICFQADKAMTSRFYNSIVDCNHVVAMYLN